MPRACRQDGNRLAVPYSMRGYGLPSIAGQPAFLACLHPVLGIRPSYQTQ